MTIKQLTPDQVRTMSLEEKDEWWLKNVYRGDMPQLTWRSGITGMILGGVLSLTNLYIGAQTGWSLGVGLTSVILAFAFFKVLSKVRLGTAMTVLENNAMQSIATSAGYMNASLFSSLATYSMITGTIIPMGQAMVWIFILALLGVLFAFPMKKRFINDQQLPFPDGMATGIVMDALHESDEKEGLFKAKLLLGGSFLSGLIELARNDKVMRALFALKNIPQFYDELLYEGRLAALLKKWGVTPTLHGIPLQELSIRFDTGIIFIATGGLIGIHTGLSLLVGGILNYVILAPLLIEKGIILASGGHYGFEQIIVWSLWGGTSCMTTSSLYAFFSKPGVIVDAFRALNNKNSKGGIQRDALAHIELPVKLSLLGVPVLGGLLVVLQHFWFGIDIWLSVVAIPLVFIFSVIAANATALTGITPIGPLGQLTQVTYGLLAPGNIAANILTAGVTGEVTANASNLLMDIKPGYMLGGKPRHQAIGHVLGALAGIGVSVPVWYLVIVHGDVSRYGTQKLPVPAALMWKAVTEVLTRGFESMHPTVRIAVIVGAIVGLVTEITKTLTKGRFSFSAVGLGLAFTLPFSVLWSMVVGSILFWLIGQRAAAWRSANGPSALVGGASPGENAPLQLAPALSKRPWYVLAAENTETLCAGVIAGGALIGIGSSVLGVLVLPDAHELTRFGGALSGLLSGAPK